MLSHIVALADAEQVHPLLLQVEKRFEITRVACVASTLGVHFIYLLGSVAPFHKGGILVRAREFRFLVVSENPTLYLLQPRTLSGDESVNVLHILTLPLYQNLLHVIIDLLEGDGIALLLGNR